MPIPRLSSFIVHRSSLLLLLALPACSATPTLPAMKFDTITATIKDKHFTLEVADTDAKRERGLMFRTSMPADHGMIFIFDTADKYGFWMKNTEIPLDILFLDDAAKIVDIRTMQPHDETPTPPDSPALFAIELNAGTAQSLSIGKGDIVQLPEKILKREAHSDDK